MEERVRGRDREIERGRGSGNKVSGWGRIIRRGLEEKKKRKKDEKRI